MFGRGNAVQADASQGTPKVFRKKPALSIRESGPRVTFGWRHASGRSWRKHASSSILAGHDHGGLACVVGTCLGRWQWKCGMLEGGIGWGHGHWLGFSSAPFTGLCLPEAGIDQVFRPGQATMRLLLFSPFSISPLQRAYSWREALRPNLPRKRAKAC